MCRQQWLADEVCRVDESLPQVVVSAATARVGGTAGIGWAPSAVLLQQAHAQRGPPLHQAAGAVSVRPLLGKRAGPVCPSSANLRQVSAVTGGRHRSSDRTGLTAASGGCNRPLPTTTERRAAVDRVWASPSL